MGDLCCPSCGKPYKDVVGTTQRDITEAIPRLIVNTANDQKG
jgi:transposase